MVHIESLPDNIKLPNPIIHTPKHFWWFTERQPELRLHCCFCDLVDGWNVLRLPMYTTKTFEVVARFLAKFTPPTIEGMCIKYRGVDETDNVPVVEVQLKLIGQPSTGTLAWLSFLRVGWEFQLGSLHTDRITCVPDYIVKVLKRVSMRDNHLPIPPAVSSELTTTQVVRLLYALKSGVYDETAHTRGNLHATSRKVLS